MAIKKILIIRFSSIGDIVLTSPIVRCAANQLGAEVHFLTKTSFESVVSQNPFISKVYTIQEKVSEVIDDLQSEGYDHIIDLHKNIRSKRVIRKLGKPYSSFDKLNIQKWLFTAFKLNFLPDKHIVDRYFEGVSHLGIKNDHAGLDHFIRPEDEALALAYKQDYSSYAVLVLGANYYTKRIPLELAGRIIQNCPLPMLILGGKDVQEEATKLQASYPSCINLAGKISLGESAGYVKHATEVHTSDTGLMHMAAAFKRKIYTYWGSTTPVFGMYAYLPENAPNRVDKQVVGLKCQPCSKLGHQSCPKKHFKCMMEQEV